MPRFYQNPTVRNWTGLTAALWIFLCALIHAEEPATEAIRAYKDGKREEAVSLFSKAIEKDPRNIEFLSARAAIYAELKQYAKAAADFEAVAQLGQFSALRQAGAEYFFAGKFDASISSFDAFAKQFPEAAPQLWERGIVLFYARRYADGRKQFELHKTVNPHDVENAAWHFICAAREIGVEKARTELMAIDTNRDSRVPMKQVYLLFKGDGTSEDVLTGAKAGNPTAAELKNNLCYAHLYLGLYFEALGDEQKAREHIQKAAVEFAEEHYMGQVARVHWEQIKDKH